MNIIKTVKYNNKVKHKKCEACGKPAFAHFEGSPFCRRHYLQMRRGGIKERTNRDLNKITELDNGTVSIELYDRNSNPIEDRIIIDKEDLDLIKNNKIGLGRFGDKKYGYLTKDGKVKLLHRYLWESKNGDIKPGFVVDHISGEGLNNTRKNLRLASALENSYNLKKDNKYTGVNKISEDKYVARIMHDNNDYHLGTYPSLREALDRRLEAERKYFGAFGPNLDYDKSNLLNYSQYERVLNNANTLKLYNQNNFVLAGVDHNTGSWNQFGILPYGQYQRLWNYFGSGNNKSSWDKQTNVALRTEFLNMYGRLPTTREFESLVNESSKYNINHINALGSAGSQVALDSLMLIPNLGPFAVSANLTGKAAKVLAASKFGQKMLNSGIIKKTADGLAWAGKSKAMNSVGKKAGVVTEMVSDNVMQEYTEELAAKIWNGFKILESTPSEHFDEMVSSYNKNNIKDGMTLLALRISDSKSKTPIADRIRELHIYNDCISEENNKDKNIVGNNKINYYGNYKFTPETKKFLSSGYYPVLEHIPSYEELVKIREKYINTGEIPSKYKEIFFGKKYEIEPFSNIRYEQLKKDDPDKAEEYKKFYEENKHRVKPINPVPDSSLRYSRGRGQLNAGPDAWSPNYGDDERVKKYHSDLSKYYEIKRNTEVNYPAFLEFMEYVGNPRNKNDIDVLNSILSNDLHLVNLKTQGGAFYTLDEKGNIRENTSDFSDSTDSRYNENNSRIITKEEFENLPIEEKQKIIYNIASLKLSEQSNDPTRYSKTPKGVNRMMHNFDLNQSEIDKHNKWVYDSISKYSGKFNNGEQNYQESYKPNYSQKDAFDVTYKVNRGAIDLAGSAAYWDRGTPLPGITIGQGESGDDTVKSMTEVAKESYNANNDSSKNNSDSNKSTSSPVNSIKETLKENPGFQTAALGTLAAGGLLAYHLSKKKKKKKGKEENV